MASKYWIKLYHEILHDPKMGQLPDRLWRRVIELFLLAGEFDLNGELPSIKEMCWTLRISEDECNETLQQLQRLGVAHCNDNEIWVITHFADRQAANTSTERSRAHRERKRQEKQLKHLRNDSDNVQRNVAPDTDTDTESTPIGVAEKPQPARSKPSTIPAVKIHVEVTGKYLLNKTQISEVDKIVGRDPPALECWRDSVKAWMMNGNRPTDLSGQLEWFRTGKRSNYTPKENGASNGTYKNQESSRAPAGRASPGHRTDAGQQSDDGGGIPAQVAAAFKRLSRAGGGTI